MLACTNACSTWSKGDELKMLQTQVRSVRPMHSTIKVPPYGKPHTFLVGHSPSFSNKPVLVKIEYARPSFVSAKVIER